VIAFAPPRTAGGVIFFQRPPDVVNRASYHLLPGESLALGGSLVSNNATYKFVFQKEDGNLVLYKDNRALWDANTQGRGGVRLDMQPDGNLVLYDANRAPVWYSATDGHPGAFFQMQDDGNAVVYAPPNVALWETRTWGGFFHAESHSWLADAVATVGRPFAAVAHGVAEGFKDVGTALGDIPVIGPALSGVVLIASGPFTFTDSVIAGQRIDRALIADFRNKITAIREVAPYAQTVVSFIPGIGQGVSAAIGASLALAQGKPLDEALVAGIEDALPGGPLAKAAFRITVAAASGDNVLVATGSNAIDALGLDPTTAQALHKALGAVYDASQGENVGTIALEQARDLVPGNEGKQAFDVAVAVAQGKKLQATVVNGIANMTPREQAAITDVGASLIAKTPALQAAAQAVASNVPRGQFPLGDAAKQGYTYGIGVMHHAGVNEKTLNMLRDKLTDAAQQKGFDTAVAIYKGAVTTQVPATAPPAASAAYLAAKGNAGNPNPMIAHAVQSFFVVNPTQRAAWTVASKAYAPSDGFFTWLLRKLGL